MQPCEFQVLVTNLAIAERLAGAADQAGDQLRLAA
jgi:hypothetical protein